MRDFQSRKHFFLLEEISRKEHVTCQELISPTFSTSSSVLNLQNSFEGAMGEGQNRKFLSRIEQTSPTS